MRGALDGIRVVDFGRYIAGPLVGALLADFGADVVAVEPPGGPALGATAAVLGRNKRRVQLDLDEAADRVRARALVATADVVLENGRPGALASHGVGFEAARAGGRAGLITCSMPGFSSDHPLAGMPGFEGAVGAAAGIYEPPATRRPVYTPLSIPSIIAALYAANAVVAALYARERDGLGQHIEVPLYDACLAPQELSAMFLVSPPSAWNTLQWAASPFINGWACADDTWLYLHAGMPHHLSRLLQTLERLGHHDAVAKLHTTLSETTLSSPSTVGTPWEAWLVRRTLRAMFALRTAAEWEDRLAAAGLCAVQIRSGAAWLQHEHPLSDGQLVDLHDPELGDIRAPGPPIRLSKTPAKTRARAAPVEADDVLAGWPSPQDDNPARTTARPPLDGVRVLDLTQVIAGPAAGRTLAELGAEVTRIENPRLDEPWVAPFHIAFNAGKRSAMLDLSTDAGRDVALALIADFAPDIVLDSFRTGVADRLGIGEQALRAILPDVVYVHVTAYGEGGTWGDRPGWEQTAQAVAGIQHDWGGPTSPDLFPMAVNDFGTGLLAALGAQVALFHRARGGGGQRVSTALTATAALLQLGWLYDLDGKVWDQPRGKEALGSRPLHRWYRAADGWAFLAAPRGCDLSRVVGLERLYADRPSEHDLERAIRTATVTDWRDRLRSAGLATQVAWVPRQKPRDVLTDAWARARGLATTREIEGLGPVGATGPPVRMSRTPLRRLGHGSARGADTAAILQQLGLTAPQVPVPVSPPQSRLRWLMQQISWAIYLALPS
jgi:crotonobetainyl-CoA:carnitine CoA-transferase CaiB-like acyl-CoA transferase